MTPVYIVAAAFGFAVAWLLLVIAEDLVAARRNPPPRPRHTPVVFATAAAMTAGLLAVLTAVAT